MSNYEDWYFTNIEFTTLHLAIHLYSESLSTCTQSFNWILYINFSFFLEPIVAFIINLFEVIEKDVIKPVEY